MEIFRNTCATISLQCIDIPRKEIQTAAFVCVLLWELVNIIGNQI